jgi:hypothetical protein
MTKHVLYLFSIISSYHYTNQNKTSKQQKTKTNKKKRKAKKAMAFNLVMKEVILGSIIIFFCLCLEHDIFNLYVKRVYGA